MVMAIPWGVLPGFEAIVSTILLVALDWRLACIAIVLWPWTLLAPRSASKRASEASDIYKRQESQLLGRLAENLSVQPLVKAFNLQKTVIAEFRTMNQAVAQSSRCASFDNSLMERRTTSGILIIQVGVLATSAYMAFQGSISLGTLVSFQGLLLMLSNSLLYVMQYGPTVVQAGTALRRIQSLLRETPGVVDLPAAVELRRLERTIAFNDVDFSYDGQCLNLAGITLCVPRGSNVAFVGGSGSGKSTALTLLMRFYDPSKGALEIDGKALTSVTQESLRAQIGVVFQDSFLLNISIRENIRVGKLHATDEEIQQAARQAEIHDAIMAMPQQYDTVVGERGGKLSGGQRQRIAIARAIIKDPQILLLDEATSALDPATEAMINATLLKLSRGRTVISVTHRLASITGADEIFVFGAGRMIESGNHARLLERGAAYAQLWAKQAGFSFAPDGSQVSVSPDRLRAIRTLADLEPDQLAATAHMCVQHFYHAGSDVFKQDDPGDKFYLIARGRFHVIRDGEVISTLEDGDCFGEIALMTDRPRNATVRAITSSTCLTLDREHFQELLRSSPRTQQRINELVEQRMVEDAAEASQAAKT
jgi:ATP-binding cassette subfamily B protein